MSGNILTSAIAIKLIDEVSKPARTITQALRDAEKAAAAVGKGMGNSGSDPFRRQLASLKLTASELRDVRKEYLLYARAQKQAMGADQWKIRGQGIMLAREKQILAAARASSKERAAEYKMLTASHRARTAMNGGKFIGHASDFASMALPGAAGMAIGMGASAAGGIAVGAAATYGMKQAIDFEKAMAEVKKKVNLDIGATYAGVEMMINASARRIGLAREEVAGLVAQAGQAGIEFKDLAGFMDLTTKGAVAFDIPAREMAQKLSEMKASTQWSNKELGDFVDKVNMLGDTGASSERQIVEMFGRSAAAAKAANVPLDTTLAVTTALNSVGMNEEVASRFWNSFSAKLRTAGMEGKKVKEAYQQLGLTVWQVDKGMQKDATGTIIDVLSRLQRSPNKAAIGVRLFGGQWWDEAARAGQAIPEIIKNLNNLNDTSKWKGSADQALNIQLETAANHLERLKALSSEVGDNIARWALPTINSTVDSLISNFEKFKLMNKLSAESDDIIRKGGRDLTDRERNRLDADPILQKRLRKSLGSGESVSSYETRLGLDRQLVRAPAKSIFENLGARAYARKAWAQEPSASPFGVKGGIASSAAPAFARIEGITPHFDLTALNSFKAEISSAIELMHQLSAQVSIHIDTSALDAIPGKAAVAKSAVAGISSAAASASAAVGAAAGRATIINSKIKTSAAVARNNYTDGGVQGGN